MARKRKKKTSRVPVLKSPYAPERKGSTYEDVDSRVGDPGLFGPPRRKGYIKQDWNSRDRRYRGL